MYYINDSTVTQYDSEDKLSGVPRGGEKTYSELINERK